MIELNQLAQLKEIVDSGTLSKAAEVLMISQPALTRSIQRLEEELGLPLFERKKNKITLNENGQLAYEYAHKLLILSEEMLTTLQAVYRSHQVITIGSCAPAPTWALTSIFHELYPDMKVVNELNFNQNDLLKGLESHHYSLIVMNEKLHHEEYHCIELFEEHLYLSVPPAHPLALFHEIAFRDLDGESVLLFSKIGFWNEVCLKMIPNSHLLIQENHAIFSELTKASALPNFISNVNLLRETTEENRVRIKITDQEASTHYYAIFSKKDFPMFHSIQEKMKALDWKTTKEIF